MRWNYPINPLADVEHVCRTTGLYTVKAFSEETGKELSVDEYDTDSTVYMYRIENDTLELRVFTKDSELFADI